MKTRRVSSYSSSGREYPQIRLSGNWLKEHGYYPGTEFEVTAEDDILLIHPRSDAPPRPRYAVEDEARPSNPHFDITEYRVELSLSRPQTTERPPIHGPADIARFLSPLQALDREAFYAVHMDARNRLCGLEQISVGTLNASLVHPREVYKGALLANASRIIVAHNHPSGNLDPSKEDLTVTKRLSQAGEILGVPLLDHVVIGGGGYRSISKDAR